MSVIQRATLREALRKSYQQRTIQEHRIIVNSLKSCFPALSKQRAKLLSFYIELIEGPTQIIAASYPNHSFVIKFKEDNDQGHASMSMIGSKNIEVCEGELVCLLNYQKYLNVQALGETSIEKQLNFWDSSEYFCSMADKKFLQMMREADIRVFHENQNAFYQGQQVTKTESGSGVYIVRTGEFSFYRENQGKEIESFRFASGSIFGALEILENSDLRAMTARCKTQKSIVYHFSEETFRRLMARYCEQVIKKKQEKLMKFIEKKEIDNMFKSRSLSDTLRKTKNQSQMTSLRPIMRSTQFQSVKSMQATERSAFPSLKIEQIRQGTNKKFFNTFKESLRIEAQGMKRSDYFSLRKDGPLKMYPMASQRSNFLTSQFKMLDKLLETRKEVGRQTSPNAKIQENTKGVWKRDMVTSFYRSNFYRKTHRNPQMIQQ